MTISEIQKLKSVTLYILNKCESLDYFHLFKVLYFANRNHLAAYGRAIINDCFCALENGPVPSFLYDAVKMAIGKSPKNENYAILYNCITSASKDYDYQLKATEYPDMSELSKSDIECLDESIEENKTIEFRQLSQKSHDGAWRQAWATKKASAMDVILIAKSGGASEETIEYIQDNLDIDNALS